MKLVRRDTHITEILQYKRERNMYVVKKINNVSSRLLPIRQLPDGNSCTWTYDIPLHIAANNDPIECPTGQARSLIKLVSGSLTHSC